MSSTIFQKLFVLVLGTPEDTVLGPYLEQRVEHEGWDSLIADVNTYLSAQAEVRGAANLIQEMAWNGFGLHLSDGDAASFAAQVSSGASTWADLLAFAILNVHGTLGATLSNRAEAAGAFTDALFDQSKGGLYTGANIQGAAHNLLVSINADSLSFEQGTDSLLALVDNLAASGLGGVISDGRISGATVFVDANGNGVMDAGEQVDTAGADGSFQVATGAATGTLIMFGGTDILAVTAFHGVMQAPAGSTVVTPLTSLAEALLDIGFVDTAIAGSDATTAALGLPLLNVLNYDPIAVLADPESTEEELALALAVEKVAVKLMTLVGHLVTALMSTGEDEQHAGQLAWEAIAQAVADGTLDLTDPESIADIINDAVGAAGGGISEEEADQIAEVVAAINEQADDADNIVDLAKVAVIGEGDSIDALEEALDDGDGLDGFVDDFTGDNLEAAIEEADPGFLLPGVPVDGEGGPNVPPSGTATNLSVAEDTPHTFAAEDFGFEDANAGDELATVRIDSVPAEGTLMLEGEAVTAGELVAADDLDLLVYTPEANANGEAYTSFTYTVQDSQGAFDTATRTMTVDVAPVNDVPTGTVWIVGFEVAGEPLFANQDLADIEGMGELYFTWYADGEEMDTHGSKLTLTEHEVGKLITVTASYVDGAGTAEAVTSEPTDPIRSANIPPEGEVLISGTPTEDETLTASHTLTDADGMGEVSWQWQADGVNIEGATTDQLVLTQAEVGKAITVIASYEDGRGHGENVESDPTEDVANVNDAPTLTTVATATIDEDEQVQFTYADLVAAADEFDEDGDTLSFRIEGVGDDGTLEIWDGEDWVGVTAGVTLVSPDDTLRYTPEEHLNGNGIPVFTVVAWDGEYDSGEDVQVSVNITPVNDPPTLTTVNTLGLATEDTFFEITYETLAAAADEDDVEGDTISFKVSAVQSGTLEVLFGEDWVAVGEDELISAGETLRWKADADANGEDLAAFTIVANDGDLDSIEPVTVYVDVDPVNDAPTLTTVATLGNATEDIFFEITYATLAAAADDNDVEGDTLSFLVDSVTSGTLEVWDGEDWVASGNGEVLSAGETLRWRADANANGEDLDAFTIVASDGLLESSPSVQVRVDVDAVNDAPTLTTVDTLGEADEDTFFTITYDDLAAAADEDDVDGDALSFRVGTVSSGTLQIWNGEDWAAAGEDTLLSDGGMLRWRANTNANGEDLNAFTVFADDGDLVSSPEVQVRVDVAAVNDAPTLTTITTLTGATEDFGFEITYDTLLAAANEADIDSTPISFRIEAVSTGTLLKWDGDSWEAISAGTTTLGTGEKLQWTGAADANGTGLNAFTVVAFDGSAPSTSAVQVKVDVTAAPEPPVLDATKSPALTAVSETVGVATPTAPTNGSTTGATQVSTLVGETGIANVTDVDSDTHGLAITAFNAASQGSLWYSTNGGTNWTELTSATAAAALLLDSNDWIFFKPDGGVEAATISEVFTFKAWDQSTGSSGTTVDTTAQSSEYSLATDTVAITITASAGASTTMTEGGTFFGGSGNDSITGSGQSDTIYGGAGNDTILADNGGDVVYGGSGDDSITGGNATDTIQGGSGNDIINGDNGVDQIRFETTASGNGIDAITVVVGSSQDVLTFPSSIVSSVVEGPTGTAGSGTLDEFTSASNGAVNISGKVVTFSGGTASTGVDTAAELFTAALQDQTDFVMTASTKAVIVAGGTTANTAYVYYVENDATAAVSAGEVTLVAILNLGSDDIDNFHLSNFGFY